MGSSFHQILPRGRYSHTSRSAIARFTLLQLGSPSLNGFRLEESTDRIAHSYVNIYVGL